MTTALALIAAPIAAAGAVLLARAGLRHIEQLQVLGRVAVIAAVFGVAGAWAITTAGPLTPLSIAGLIAWVIGMSAGSGCDVLTQRIPAVITNLAMIVAVVLLTAAAIAHGAWHRLLIAGLTAGGVYAVLVVACLVAGLGYGDARLGCLGGLGVGWVGLHGIWIGIAVMCVVTFGQAMVALVRGAGRGSMIAYGPGLALGFFAAIAAAGRL